MAVPPGKLWGDFGEEGGMSEDMVVDMGEAAGEFYVVQKAVSSETFEKV